MVDMTDPDVISYERPLYSSEADQLGDLNISGHYLDFGLYFTTGKRKLPVEFPPSIGRFVIIALEQGENHVREEFYPTNCTENAFKDLNVEIDPNKI